MNNSMADLKFVSASDLEILRALTLANEITKKYSSNSMQWQTSSDIQRTISDEFVGCDVNSQATSTNSSDSDGFISAYNSFKFDFEYGAVCHDVECINVMCDSFIEKNRELEKEIYSFIKDISSSAEEIISTKQLCERVEQINHTVEHILLIRDKIYRIQQVLQEKPFEMTLKVNPSCQKSVLKVFTTAKEIMGIIQQQVEYFENYNSKNAIGMEAHYKELQSMLHNKILELAKRIDIISQFRDQMLQTSIQNSVSGSNLDILLS